MSRKRKQALSTSARRTFSPPARERSARRRVPAEIVIILALILGVGLMGGLWYFVLQPNVVAGPGLPPVSAGEPVAETSAAPDFTATDLAGHTVSLSDYRGQPVVLNTWATWCAPCRAEMPDLEVFYQKYRDQGVIVLAVNLGDPRDRVAEFVQDGDYTFPVLLDESTAAVGRPYRVSAIPTTFFIDREGQIVSIRRGSMSLAEMERRVAEIL